mmetsp:Transcript_3009/g.5982  ORF Transcript_3009/g.5982 Transcript_3009/m.5982 type:complete len:377 (-) Transcript_3009:12-1142(-)
MARGQVLEAEVVRRIGLPLHPRRAQLSPPAGAGQRAVREAEHHDLEELDARRPERVGGADVRAAPVGDAVAPYLLEEESAEDALDHPHHGQEQPERARVVRAPDPLGHVPETRLEGRARRQDAPRRGGAVERRARERPRRQVRDRRLDPPPQELGPARDPDLVPARRVLRAERGGAHGPAPRPDARAVRSREARRARRGVQVRSRPGPLPVKRVEEGQASGPLRRDDVALRALEYHRQDEVRVDPVVYLVDALVEAEEAGVSRRERPGGAGPGVAGHLDDRPQDRGQLVVHARRLGVRGPAGVALEVVQGRDRAGLEVVEGEGEGGLAVVVVGRVRLGRGVVVVGEVVVRLPGLLELVVLDRLHGSPFPSSSNAPL